MPYWTQKKTNRLINTLKRTHNNMNTYGKQVQYHKKKSRSVLSRYHQTHPNAKVSAWEFKKLERQVRKNMNEKHTLRINDAVKTQLTTDCLYESV